MSCINDSLTLAAQYQLTGTTTIEAGAPVLFNSTLKDATPYITYDSTTGIFTINQRGNYLLNWEIMLDGADAGTSQFDVLVNGEVYQTVYVPFTSGELVGSTTVFVPNNGATIQIVNSADTAATIADLPVQANISITQV